MRHNCVKEEKFRRQNKWLSYHPANDGIGSWQRVIARYCLLYTGLLKFVKGKRKSKTELRNRLLKSFSQKALNRHSLQVFGGKTTS